MPGRAATTKKSFAGYRAAGANWITLSTGEYYPDILPEACELYKPVLVMFGQLLKRSESSVALFMNVSEVTQTWMRIQLARVFRKYVCPVISVEMLKKKTHAKKICDAFGDKFRPINEVQAAFASRPIPDEAICAVLWEYKERGQKGYDLTDRLFSIIQKQHGDLAITGPRGAGRDIRLGEIWSDYPNPTRPVDFIIAKGKDVLAVGLARYDSDRGGAQEDDRTGGYRDCAQEILAYANKKGLRRLKVIFVNDGPGLLLGSMWTDYARIEESGKGRIRVVTLRMVPERITRDWLVGE